MFGILIDKETRFVIDKCIIIDNHELKANESIINYDNSLGNPVCNMNKPQLVDGVFIDREPLPPIVPEPQEPNEMEVLTARVDGLENINAGLLLENAGHQINIQEQEKMNKEQEVTNANLLLEIAMLKGAVL